MKNEIKRSDAWLTDAKKRLTDITTASEKTSDRKEIGQLKVQKKLVEVEIEDATARIADLNKSLEQRNTEYQFRVEEQEFENQI